MVQDLQGAVASWCVVEILLYDKLYYVVADRLALGMKHS